jgi:hypothetical protein
MENLLQDRCGHAGRDLQSIDLAKGGNCANGSSDAGAAQIVAAQVPASVGTGLFGTNGH